MKKQTEVELKEKTAIKVEHVKSIEESEKKIQDALTELENIDYVAWDRGCRLGKKTDL